MARATLMNWAEVMDRFAGPGRSMARLLFADRDPSAVAYMLIAPDLTAQRITWGALDRDSAEVARGLLSIGVAAGDRVATLMQKSKAYLSTLMAIWRIGAVHVPIFTAFAAEPIRYRLAASGCRLVVCDPAQEHKLAGPVPSGSSPAPTIITSGSAGRGLRTLDEVRAAGSLYGTSPDCPVPGPIIEIYTSGTTGNPKGVVVGLKALAAFQVYLEWGLGITRDDVYWNAADPGWAYGLYYSVLAPCLTETTALMFEGAFSPDTYLRILREFSVTNFAAAPTVYRAIQAAASGDSPRLALKRASSAGEPLTSATNEWAQRCLGVAIHDHYGQTETGMVVNNHHHPGLSRPLRPGSMGLAMPGWSVAILQPERDEVAGPGENGRVAVDLPNSPLAWFGGYANEPQKSAEKFAGQGRWYLTGDVGRQDADGYLYFSSRDDDVIIMSGYRIGPIEVETALASHSAVAECAVVAIPHRIMGEQVEAVVVLRPGIPSSDSLTEALQELVKRTFAAHAYPRRIHYVAALPKTASGKIQRSRIRAELANPVAS